MKKVYFFEGNIPMGRTVYLPLVSGILAAYAKTYPAIKKSYEFMKPLYKRDLPVNILKHYDNPSIACFSVSLWNFELSKEIARLVKEKYPDCLIIFGGPSAPFDGVMEGVDYVINGEGEKKFVNILLRLIGEPEIEVKQEQDLDHFPSPYSSGEFDQVIKDDMEFQAIVETNRGCPFLCTYCFWGMAGNNKRFRFHSVEQVKEEADWIGRNRIKYVFCADSNFGMFKRDIEIAQIYADVKAKYGYPEKFRVCYGKNAQESIYETAKVLSKAGLAKAITLAKQTDNQLALDNVKRTNISNKVYNELQQRYMAEGIPTYVELILGLPGETLQSFKEGVQSAMVAKTNLFIYHCSVLPNTEMDRKEYREKHGLKTAWVPMAEIHCSPREPGAVQEHEEIIIGTNTMTTDEWIESAVYAWATQLRYSLNCHLMDSATEEWFYKIAHEITQGKPRGQLDPLFGNIYWEPEELAYLRLMYDPVEFARKNILYRRKGGDN
jgi:putative methyltransferase